MPGYAAGSRDCSELVDDVPRQEVHVVIREGHPEQGEGEGLG